MPMQEQTVRLQREPLVSPGECDMHARDMTATFSADMTLRMAQQQLGQIGQWLPIDGDPRQPLGGLVEENSTGPLRLGYGAWRDLLLGVQFTNGLGELITAGGRTVKNVAGYDLTKLMVGQFGALGRIVTITTRTWRRPAGALSARFDPDPALISRLLATPLRPQWSILQRDVLWCGYLGDEATLAFYRSHVQQLAPKELVSRSVDEDIEHRAAIWSAHQAPEFHASIPPARLIDFIRACALTQFSADPVFGIVGGPLTSDNQREALKQAAQDMQGAIRFVIAAGGSPRAVDISTNPTERRIIEQIKQAFDPEKRLTPLPWQDV